MNFITRLLIMGWNRKWWILLVLLSIGFTGRAQYTSHRFVVYFKDKANTPYSLSNPQAYLSPQAIARRQMQNIPIDSTDLPVDPNYISQVLAVGNVTLINRLKWFNAICVEADSSLLPQIEALTFVVHLKRVQVMKAPRPLEAHANIYQPKTGSEYGLALNQIDMINGRWLHEAGYKGSGVLIASLDAGYTNVLSINSLQPLFMNNQVVAIKDFAKIGDDMLTSEYHGTFTLSTMGAYLPDTIIGTAPEADFALLRTEVQQSEYLVEEANWVAGAIFADSLGASIFSVSLGYTQFDDTTLSHTYQDMNGHTTLITRAAEIAASKGILVVASAGNDGNHPWHHIGAPADGDSVLAVGAVDPNGNFAFFSSFGPTADGRIKPDVVAQGENAVFCGYQYGVGIGNGTSFSCPIIAGMAACLWQKNPTATNMEILNSIRESASLYNMPNDSMGYGIPNLALADSILNHPLGLSPSPVNNGWRLSPNPAKDMVRISSFKSSGRDIQISLFSLAGKLLLKRSETGNSFQLDVSNLPSGMYVVKLQSPEESALLKLVKK